MHPDEAFYYCMKGAVPKNQRFNRWKLRARLRVSLRAIEDILGFDVKICRGVVLYFWFETSRCGWVAGGGLYTMQQKGGQCNLNPRSDSWLCFIGRLQMISGGEPQEGRVKGLRSIHRQTPETTCG